jgi:hypothetical protein
MSKAISIWRSRIWLGPVLIPTPIHRESSLGQGHIDMRINIFAYYSLGPKGKDRLNKNYPIQDLTGEILLLLARHFTYGYFLYHEKNTCSRYHTHVDAETLKREPQLN